MKSVIQKTVVGVAALKKRLSQLAAGEFVNWSRQMLGKPKGELSYPLPKEIQDIEKFARQHKLNFSRPN